MSTDIKSYTERKVGVSKVKLTIETTTILECDAGNKKQKLDRVMFPTVGGNCYPIPQAPPQSQTTTSEMEALELNNKPSRGCGAQDFQTERIRV